MISKKLKKRIRIIKNFPKKGILFQDITSITDDYKLFVEVINEIVNYTKKKNFVGKKKWSRYCKNSELHTLLDDHKFSEKRFYN